MEVHSEFLWIGRSSFATPLLFWLVYLFRKLCIHQNSKDHTFITCFQNLKALSLCEGGQFIEKALRASRQRIVVFLMAVLAIATIMGTLIYLIEDPKDGFTSIPRSIYWAIVTLTTVGYGDISPQTGLGQFFASIIMILGYAIIAVPTGLISVELSRAENSIQSCPSCSKEGHDDNAKFCKYCGADLGL